MDSFFANSQWLDYMVLKPLAHIRGNCDTFWDEQSQSYRPEEDSYAELLNALIYEIEATRPPQRYHDNEDRLAEYVRDKLKWPIFKKNGRWIGAEYESILEYGGYIDDSDQENLVLATAGRVQAAKNRCQNSFDDMEESHQRMVAAVLSVILFHRMNE